MEKLDEFFDHTIPEALEKLQADKRPLWGSMTAEDMLLHLMTAFKMSRENTHGEILTPTEKLSVYQRFLSSDQDFRPNQNQPSYFEEEKVMSQGNFADLKQEFGDSLRSLRQFFRDNPQHTAVHASFGKLSVEQWQQLNYKHLRHHFKQFGLIDNV